MPRKPEHPVTVVWELVGGDAFISPVKLMTPVHMTTEADLLAALTEGDDTNKADIRIIATFTGHHESVWGGAIQE